MSVFERYRKSLKPLEVEEWVDILIYRPLGYLVAKPLSYTPITPNMVTIISVVVGLAGAYYISSGEDHGIILGALLYASANVLDCTDGQLARMTDRFSRYGRIFDGVADYVVGLAAFIAIGIGWRPEGYDLTEWWLLVLIGGMVCMSYQSMHLNHIRESYLHLIGTDHVSETRQQRRKNKATSKKRKFFLLPFYMLFLLYLRVERVVRRTVKVPIEAADPQRRAKGLRFVLILWTFTGKGTHVTMLTLFLLLKHPEDYCWVSLIPWNLWILATWIIHKRVIRSHTLRGVIHQ